jgi:hypothetical protein
MAPGGAGGLIGALLPPLSNKAGFWIQALDQDLTGGMATDYRQTTDVAMGDVHNTSRFGYVAYPEAYGNSGRWAFILNESGVVYRLDPGQDLAVGGAIPMPVIPAWRNYPDNPTGNGWGKLD